MAKKELTLIIRARNAVAAGFASVGKSIGSFTKGLFSIGKAVTVGLVAASAAVGAFAVKALSAWAKQEKAVRSLSSALAAAGDDYTALLPKLKASASAIQKETGAADEATLAGMARLRMLGVQADKLEEAAKATIALKAVGIEEAAAQKAVAMAMQGSYEMLQRFVPALRTAKDETEKARIVNDLFAKGYAQQRALLGTVSGAWAAFKGRIGDVWEEFGKAIDRAGGITAALHRAGDAVEGFGQRVAEWIDSEKFQALQASIQGVVAAMESSKGRAEIGAALKEVVVATFVVAAETAVALLKKGAIEIGGLISKSLKDGLGLGRKKETREEVETAARQLGIEEDKGLYRAAQKKMAIRGRAFIGFEDEKRTAIKLQIARNRADEAGVELSEDATRAQIRLAAALKNLNDVADKYKPAPFVGPPAPEPAPVAIDVDADEVADAVAETVDETAAAKKAIEDLEAEQTAAVKAELDARWQAQQDAAEKELELAKELAGKKVAEFIAEAKEKQKTEKEAARDADREAKRAAMLQERQAKGGRLSKQQQQWLDAFRAIEAAKGAVPGLQGQIDVAKENLLESQKSTRSLAAIERDLVAHNAKLDRLLNFGGA